MVKCENCKQRVEIEHLIDLREAAAMLGIGPICLYKHLSRGRFSSIRITPHGKHLFKPSRLMEEVENGR